MKRNTIALTDLETGALFRLLDYCLSAPTMKASLKMVNNSRTAVEALRRVEKKLENSNQPKGKKKGKA